MNVGSTKEKNPEKRISITPDTSKSLKGLGLRYISFSIYNKTKNHYKVLPGNYCEGVIPDPIPNSEVKPFCADGTLS